MTKKRPQYNRGVTLVEMLVVIAIFGIVASILLFNYKDFNTNVSVRNLSQDVGLTIRKAQLYATSIRRTAPIVGQVKDTTVYGIVFSLDPVQRAINNALLPNQRQFVLFADQSFDGTVTGVNSLYDSTGAACGTPVLGDECLENFSITSTDYVKKICYLASGQSTEECLDAALASTKGYTQFSILFRRPSPEAFFCVKDASSSCMQTALSYMKIIVSSSTGTEKMITVWNTGQIAVQ